MLRSMRTPMHFAIGGLCSQPWRSVQPPAQLTATGSTAHVARYTAELRWIKRPNPLVDPVATVRSDGVVE